jgi:hypothetical protein
MSNRLARLTSTMPNEEFYLLGRLPRTPPALELINADAPGNIRYGVRAGCAGGW